MPKYGDIREDGFICTGGQRLEWASPEAWRRRLESKRVYQKEKYKFGSSASGRESGRIGAACELLVRADLSKRGFEVTVPVSPTSQHDLHVELPSVGWKGVQVKTAKLNISNGRISKHGSRVESPVLALVFLPDNRVEYRAGTEPLPPELLE